MPAIAIPPTGATWWPRYVPKPLYWSIHGFDWTSFYKREDEVDGWSFNVHIRVFGFGYDLMLNRMSGLRMFQFGAPWLIQYGAGRSEITEPKNRGKSGFRFNEDGRQFLTFGIFGFNFEWGRNLLPDQRYKLRVWFDGRLIHPRKKKPVISLRKVVPA